jgi:photosystem II stability/assembly factor-like uncharacterized protein
MRFLLTLFATALATASAFAQTVRQTQSSNTTESLRGASAVSQTVAWVSGTHGTYLRTINAGHTWITAQVPDATTLDFRGVVAFSASEAFLMSAGPGDQSRIYHTSDAGQHWRLQYTATNPKSFFDSIAFWDRMHGIVLGDPVPDESGRLKFEILMTSDGKTWTSLSSNLPPALEGEGAFAASNSCLAILHSYSVPTSAAIPRSEAPTNPASSPVIPRSEALTNPASSLVIPRSEAPRNLLSADTTAASSSTTVPSQPWKSGASAPREPANNEGASAPEGNDPNIWFATGGKVARVFHSPDRGQTWQVFETPLIHGPESAGIFSIAFRDPLHGVIAGGDYKHPEQDGPNLAFTNNGGKSWTLSDIYPQSYYSAVSYDRKSIARASTTIDDNQAHIRLFLAGPKFIYDFRPPRNPTRISPPKTSNIQFNAISPFPTGGALVVGPKGSIATLP